VIAISEVTRQRLVAAGCPNERITVVPGGVDLSTIAQAPQSDETHDLIYVGRLLPHKRVHLAIEALAALRNTHPLATLAIVGDGTERDRLRALVGKLGLESAVRFYGKLPAAEQVYAQLKSSRVLVAPSEREGFGISVVEAWGCGAPAVVCAGAENAMCELIDRPFKGRVTEADGASISAACCELLEQPRAAYEQDLLTAAGEYDWPRIARRLERIYQEFQDA
jgi:glycosyltransferase involved in cell wall biosynthesis